MPAPATKRQKQYNVAKNAWQETYQNVLTTVNGGPVEGPPPNLNGVLWKEDYESPAWLARFQRIRRPNEGYLHPSDINLFGLDQFYGDPGQAVTFDLGQPFPRRLLPNVLDPINNLGTLLEAGLPPGLIIDISQPFPRKLLSVGVYNIYVNQLVSLLVWDGGGGGLGYPSQMFNGSAHGRGGAPSGLHNK